MLLYISMFAKFLDSTIGGLLSGLLDLIFNIVAWITAQVGFLLDFVVEKMVLDMADLVNNIGAIDALWEIFRDLGNIFFIGVLLYIAIRTILNVGNDFNTKKILIRLVIVALFVNFSLFATKVVIDTSNVLALQFYNSIEVVGCGEGVDCNISHFFADATNISSVQSAITIEDDEVISESSNQNFRIALARTLGIIFLLVTLFVMGAVSFLLIIRFIFLVLLMIASPIAFIAFILPGSKLGTLWWDKLLSQSFFAPVLFAMFYVTAALAAGLQNGIAGEGETDLMAAILSPDAGDNFGVILVFVIITTLMIASLVVAKQMGAAGASGAIKIGKQTRDWGQAKIARGAKSAAGAAARGTVGKVGTKLDKKFASSKYSQTWYGEAVRNKTTKKARNAKFGTGYTSEGVKGKRDSREKRYKKMDILTNDQSTDKEKKKALGDLSQRQQLALGSDTLKKNAHLVEKNTINAMEKSDEFSDDFMQSFKEAVTKPLTDVLKEIDTDIKGKTPAEVEAYKDSDEYEDKQKKIKEFMSNRNDDQLKDLDQEILTNPFVANNMRESQIETAKKDRDKDERDAIDEVLLQPMIDAVKKASSGAEPDAVNKYFGGMKKSEIANQMKREIGQNGMQNITQDVMYEIDPKILSEFMSDMKSGTQDEIRDYVLNLANDPDNRDDSKIDRSANYLERGPGAAHK